MLNNPSNPIPLPEELKKEVEKAKHQLTLDELSLHNVRRSRISEEATLSEIIIEKKNIEKEIESLREALIKFSKDRNDIEKELNELSGVKDELTNEKDKLQAGIEGFKSEMESRLKEVEKSEQELEKKKLQAKTELEKVLEEKVKAQNFISKINDIVASHN